MVGNDRSAQPHQINICHHLIWIALLGEEMGIVPLLSFYVASRLMLTVPAIGTARLAKLSGATWNIGSLLY